MASDWRPALLRLLCDGRWRSRESICAELGCTPSALHEAGEGLAAWGVAMQSRDGRAYALAQPFIPLDAERMREALPITAPGLPLDIEVLTEVDSTNAQLLREPGDSPRACVAEYQSAGRGRQGRTWISPFGANLCLSLKWHFETTPSAVSALSIAAGVAVARSLAELGLSSVGLKWPNDVLVHDRKLAGILIERRARPGGGSTVVVGVGVNVGISRQQGMAIDRPWTSVAEALQLAAPVDRNRLAASLLSHLASTLRVFSTRGIEPFRGEWSRLDSLCGRTVRALSPQGVVEGVAEGIAEDGALLLRTGNWVQRIRASDVTLRPASSRRIRFEGTHG